MVSIRVTTNAKDLASRIEKKSRRLKMEIIKGQRELAEFVRDRAGYYAPYKTGHLMRNIIITRSNNSTFTVTARARYALAQEKGVPASSFVGWRPIPHRGMVRVRKPPYHRGIQGKFFMKRAAEDGRREAVKIFGKRIKYSVRTI